MKQTENYQLSQWELTDRIQMEDFNGDNQKIDAALGALAATVAAHQAAIPKLGNCQIYAETYTGDGNTSRTFTFPKEPRLVLLMGGSYTVVAGGGIPYSSCLSTNGYGETGSVSWSGNSVTFTHSLAFYACNTQEVTYSVIALLAADA